MSITESNTVDGIATDQTTNRTILLVSDHLDWSNEHQHLILLQDKLNAYLSFIESEQVYSAFPDARGTDGFIVEIKCKYEPTENARKLLGVFGDSARGLGVSFIFS